MTNDKTNEVVYLVYAWLYKGIDKQRLNNREK